MNFKYNITIEDYIECSIWRFWDSKTNRDDVNKNRWIMMLGMLVILGIILWFSSDRRIQGIAIIMFLLLAPSTFFQFEKNTKELQEKHIRKQIAEGKIPFSGQVELTVNEHGVYSEEKNSILKASYDEIRNIAFTDHGIYVFTGYNEVIIFPHRELNRFPEKDILIEVLRSRGKTYRNYYPEAANVNSNKNNLARLYRKEYQTLSNAEKEGLLRELIQARGDFEVAGLYRFKAFGQFTDTAVYRHSDGAEFVFVPGDTVTLGWDHFAVGPDAYTQDDMLGILAESGVTDFECFLKENCTPVRQATIGPMLVERQVREIGWYRVSPDHPMIRENQELRRYVDQYLAQTGEEELEIDKTLKMQRKGEVVTVQLYLPCSWQELIQRTESEGFSVPTEDEWEYLCGGGSRTLWRWGDSFDYDMKIPYFTAVEKGRERMPDGSPQEEGKAGDHWDISWSNQFGLTIAFDPYKQEVVSGPDAILKGGDGGENICGGMGIALGFLPVATYYKGTRKDEDILGYAEDVGGSYTSYRRILRLG